MSSRPWGPLLATALMLLCAAASAAAQVPSGRVPRVGLLGVTSAAHGVHFPDLWRRAPSFVDKILRGAGPGAIPVEQASKFSLVLNLKSARALGLAIQHSLLVRADQVIE